MKIENDLINNCMSSFMAKNKEMEEAKKALKLAIIDELNTNFIGRCFTRGIDFFKIIKAFLPESGSMIEVRVLRLHYFPYIKDDISTIGACHFEYQDVIFETFLNSLEEIPNWQFDAMLNSIKIQAEKL